MEDRSALSPDRRQSRGLDLGFTPQTRQDFPYSLTFQNGQEIGKPLNLHEQHTVFHHRLQDAWKQISTQPTDFLLNPHLGMSISPIVSGPLQTDQWMELSSSSFDFSAQPVYEKPVADVGYLDRSNPISIEGMSCVSTECDSPEKKPERYIDEDVVDKNVERRQRRMIKNRESAARSRARKQAYTNQLEQEVVRLRKINHRLKNQKELNIMLSTNSDTTVPTYQLRRTSSATF